MKIKLINRPPCLFGKVFLHLIMKSIIFLFCSISLALNPIKGTGQNAEIIVESDVTLNVKQVFRLINKQTDYKFIYRHDLLKAAPNIQLKKGVIKAGDLLDKTLSPLSFTYNFTDGSTIVVKKGSVDSSERSSDKILDKKLQFQVSGTIRDNDGTPLPGANILEKGTTNGTQADFDGNFSISVENENAVLVVSYVGFANKEVPLNGQTNISVGLVESAAGLDEVVVIGYGSMRKSDLTGSIVSISSDQITQGQPTSSARAIQGKAAGVRVTQKSGRPGDEVIIRIRGGNSLSGGNDPLYVVDGLPVEGLGADFNPEDISSMEILKDASATAIYGSRGSNGVVLITTRRGKEGKGTINYHGYYGVQSLRKKIDLLDKTDYVAMQNEIAVKEGGTVLSPSEIAALPNNDWQDLAYRNALWQSHQLTASGGNENAKFYSSVNYMNQEGILKGSDYNRIGLRLNGDLKLSEKLSVQANIGFNRSIDNTSNFAADGWGAIPFQAIVMAPTTPIFDESGNYTKFTGTPWGGTNPVGYSQLSKSATSKYRVVSNIAVDYKIIDGLMLKVTAGVDVNNASYDQYNSMKLSGSGPSGGQAWKNKSNFYRLVNENILNYTKSFNDDNRLSAMAGFSYQEEVTDFMNSGRYSGFVSDVFENNNMQSAINTVPLSTGYLDSKLLSYLGRLNYTFKDRYLFTATGRYDGSSKFGINNKYAFFPSAAFAWRVSEESFMDNVTWVNSLKLRTSIGQVGNQAISPYQTLDRLTTNTAVFGSGESVGFVASGFSNENLKWETTTQTDVGIDLSFLDSRFNFVLDYYHKKTTDLLYNATLPPSSGYSSSTRNVGEIENKGLEFDLSYKNLEGAVKWNSSINMSFNRSKVVDLGKDNNGNVIERIDSPIAGGNWFPLFKDNAPFQLFGYELDGIYQTDAEAAVLEPGKKAGDYRIVDINDDGIINGQDQKLLTHLEPKLVFGMNNEIRYKNFELSFLIVGSYGNDIVNEFNKYYTALGGKWNVTQESWDNRWTGPGSTGTYATASSSATDNITFGSPSSLWVEDGSYLRLKDIKLAYNIPKSISEKINLANITVYVSGSNLLTITKYPHYDPEASWTSSAVNGWDRGVYASSKTITGGIQITF
ncbi:TonB-linked SusC/RagA family outer membrane protein [Arenibacter echinorum]|uniref:TonB-linked SusC/RagA family outer membrane protein n=2 Tax=Arenibacter echinorum TaxID=440515 RepID=A0A327QWF7_9FLAO|nr:TonB-linked SusC/RagA family outer membrane protein [Arenibacter echinorum]